MTFTSNPWSIRAFMCFKPPMLQGLGGKGQPELDGRHKDAPQKGKSRVGQQIAKCFVGTSNFNQTKEEYNEEEMRLNLDLLQERREAVAVREARYKTKMEQYYNKKVRPACFRPREFVLRRNEASMVEDQGKLGPKWEGPYRVVEAYENGSYKLQTLEDKEVPRTWHAINLRKCYM
ncbi:hypothetical protein Tco_0663536 [Tanacetum coccineum]